MAALALAALMVMTAACGSKPEGIMLVITTTEDAPVLDSLVVVAGQDKPSVFANGADGDGINDATHIHDALRDESIFLDQRHLHDDPYRYFIRASAEEGPINVAAVAFNDNPEPMPGDNIMVGTLMNLSIMDDTVLEWELQLYPAQVDRDDDCIVIGKDDSEIIITRGSDYDCDGVGAEEDCAPHDGNIAPGNLDVCDEFGAGIDNDCDGLCDEDGAPDSDGDGFNECGTVSEVNDEGDEDFFCEAAPVDCAEGEPRVHPGAKAEICDGFDTDCRPDTLHYENAVPCFPDEGECQFGSQACGDENGGGPGGDCTPTGPVVPEAFCNAYSQCAGDAGPFPGPVLECAYDVLDIETTVCTVEVTDEGPCPAMTIIEPTDVGGECNLEIISTTAPNRIGGVFDANGATTSDLCGPNAIRLGDNAAQAESHSYELLIHDIQRTGLEGYHRVQVNAKSVAQCSGQMRACPDITF